MQQRDSTVKALASACAWRHQTTEEQGECPPPDPILIALKFEPNFHLIRL
jgi:hypothetical protein